MSEARKIKEDIKKYEKALNKIEKKTDQHKQPNENKPEEICLASLNDWDMISNQVSESLKAKDYISALKAVKRALDYLSEKGFKNLQNNEPSYSHKAETFDQFSRLPLVGTLFNHQVDYYHNCGIGKTITRLKQIESWVEELKDKIDPGLFHFLGLK